MTDRRVMTLVNEKTSKIQNFQYKMTQQLNDIKLDIFVLLLNENIIVW